MFIIAFLTSYLLLLIFFVRLCLSSLEHKCHEGKGCLYLSDAASLATRTVPGTQRMLNKYQLSELVKKKIIVYVEGDQTQRMHKNFIVEFQACG